jgi:hypothetical protein
MGWAIDAGQGQESKESRSTLEHTQPPNQWVRQLFAPGLNGRRVKLTTLPSSADIKHEGNTHASSIPHGLHGDSFISSSKQLNPMNLVISSAKHHTMRADRDVR